MVRRSGQISRKSANAGAERPFSAIGLVLQDRNYGESIIPAIMKEFLLVILFLQVLQVTAQISLETLLTAKPSCDRLTDFSGFSHDHQTFLLDCPVEQAWEFYTSYHPGEIWNRKRVKFLLSVDQQSREIMPIDQADFPKIHEGQVLLLRLHLIPLKSIEVAMQVSHCDKDSGLIEFVYLDNNISRGFQQIRLVASGNQTIVIHSSVYSSGSPFRDRYMYPYFHRQFVSELHDCVQEKARELVPGPKLPLLAGG